LSVISSFLVGPWSEGLPNLKGGCGCFLWVMALPPRVPDLLWSKPCVLRPVILITTLSDFTNSLTL
jgi:hypothetical protein